MSPVVGRAHEPAQRRGHRPPPPEDSQPLAPRGHVPEAGVRGLPSQAGGGSGLVNVNNRLFAPLQGLNPNNILMGGYGWLSYTDGGSTLHPGLDLNSGSGCNDDEGALVVAPLAGVVRHTLYAASGEGNHVWVEIDDPCSPGPTWWHTDHLLRVDVREEQRLAPGESIGLCGRTGGWDCAHAHTELCKGAPSNGPWQWPYGWSRAQVEAEYWNPHFWWDAATVLVQAEQAGGPVPPPEVIEMILSGAQTASVQAAMFGDYWASTAPEFAIPTAWRDRWHEGHWPGRPVSAEQPIPADPAEDKPKGVFQLFEHGCCVWLENVGASWNG